MATKKQKIHGIIHSASLSAAAVGAGMAQLPGADAPVLVGIQTTMIVAIGAIHDVRLTEAEAAKILLPFMATVGGRGISQVLVGWIPGFGNAINAGTAAAITETVGWMAHEYFMETEPAGLIEA